MGIQELTDARGPGQATMAGPFPFPGMLALPWTVDIQNV